MKSMSRRHEKSEWGNAAACMVWPDPYAHETSMKIGEPTWNRNVNSSVANLRIGLRDPEECLKSVFTTLNHDGERIVTRDELRKAIDIGFVHPNRIRDKDFEELLLLLDPTHTNWVKCGDFLNLCRIDPHITAIQTKYREGGIADNKVPPLTIFDIDDKLREFIRLRSHQMLKDFTSHDIDTSGKVKKPHAKYIIHKHCFPLSDQQFEALWKTFPLSGPCELRYYDFLEEYGNIVRSPRPGCETSWVPKKLEGIQAASQNEGKYRTSRPWNTIPEIPSCDALMKKMVESRWREVLRRCRLADPRRTGRISAELLKVVLGQCGVPVNNKSMEDLIEVKYGLIRGTEINYWNFIRKCVGSFGEVSDDNLPANLKTSDALDCKGRANPYKILLAMRGQVLHHWRRIRQRFREKDPEVTGFIDGCDFRKILHDYSIYFSDEEYFKILQYFDPHMTGEIPYTSFLQTYANPLLY